MHGDEIRDVITGRVTGLPAHVFREPVAILGVIIPLEPDRRITDAVWIAVDGFRWQRAKEACRDEE